MENDYKNWWISLRWLNSQDLIALSWKSSELLHFLKKTLTLSLTELWWFLFSFFFYQLCFPLRVVIFNGSKWQHGCDVRKFNSKLTAKLGSCMCIQRNINSIPVSLAFFYQFYLRATYSICILFSFNSIEYTCSWNSTTFGKLLNFDWFRQQLWSLWALRMYQIYQKWNSIFKTGDAWSSNCPGFLLVWWRRNRNFDKFWPQKAKILTNFDLKTEILIRN